MYIAVTNSSHKRPSTAIFYTVGHTQAESAYKAEILGMNRHDFDLYLLGDVGEHLV